MAAENQARSSSSDNKATDSSHAKSESSENGSGRGRSPHRSRSKDKSRSTSPSNKSDRSSRSAAASRDTNSTDPESVRCRVFIGNLNTDNVDQDDLVKHFSQFGKVVGCSLHVNFGFIQYANKEDADKAVTESHGKTIFGKRVDANIASERRKPQGKDRKGAKGRPDDHPGRSSRRRSRSRSSERFRSRSPMSRYDELYRRDDPLARSDRLHSRDHYDARRVDDFYDSRDPYARPPEAYGRFPHHAPPPKTADCEIIATSGDLKNYADTIQSRLTAIGISASVMFPPADVSVLEIIDRISRSGTLYAVVITSQNMYHKSCTLNILYGAPQEHRNMPLDDALSFVARNFNQYMGDWKDRRPGSSWQPPAPFPSRNEATDKTILTQDSYIHGLLNMAVVGTHLKIVEINHLIEALIRYKNELDSADGKHSMSSVEDRAPAPHSTLPPNSSEPPKDVPAKKERGPVPDQGYFNPSKPEPYSYGVPSSAETSGYQGYSSFRSSASNVEYREEASYSSSATGQQSAPAYAGSDYPKQSSQPMSAYPNYYSRAEGR
ncbi:nuclear receptor coactivator 5-like [Rhopilema esculentum]|uniref:nuclear receptor coactivator 5-like n=1 Tax=Rhopilema esculentum TaxID=499914 RepID=UPI0031E0FEAF